MKISEYKNAPQWLVLAETKNADVEVLDSGWVIWNGGEFRGGEFRGGYFRGGEFRGGYFRGGEFLGGEFLGGEFRDGEFRDGEFFGGEFLGGAFLGGYFRGGEFRGGEFRGGEFRGGEFLGGYFLGGEFLGGEFRGGEFLGGTRAPQCKWIYGLTPDGKIKIGCKEKTIEEWDQWFNSTHEYSTPRSSVEFTKIKACYEATKAYLAVFSIEDFNNSLK
jgi:hypothetical protein